MTSLGVSTFNGDNKESALAGANAAGPLLFKDKTCAPLNKQHFYITKQQRGLL